MTRLPLSVIGGYLGAGKTTLINRLLGMDHGLRLAVLVNDFGAINIDAALLKSASEDTIELTNGCVCCTMSGDLFFTIGDLLDRDLRPDHIIVEASGIADPSKIADVALAEKDLRYAGIVTLMDGLNIEEQLQDPRIAAQVRSQLKSADLIAVSKTDLGAVEPLLKTEGLMHRTSADDLNAIIAVMFGDFETASFGGQTPQDHPAYLQWSDPSPQPMTGDDIRKRLSCAPLGLLRFKALIPDGTGGTWEVHVVGSQKDIRHRDDTGPRGLVAIALQDVLTQDQLRGWWLGKA